MEVRYADRGTSHTLLANPEIRPDGGNHLFLKSAGRRPQPFTTFPETGEPDRPWAHYPVVVVSVRYNPRLDSILSGSNSRISAA